MKKLKLNKRTIANYDEVTRDELMKINGGMTAIDPACYKTDNNASYCNTRCYTCPCVPEYGGDQ